MHKYYQSEGPAPLTHVYLLPVFSIMKVGEIKTIENKKEAKEVGDPTGVSKEDIQIKEKYQGIRS